MDMSKQHDISRRDAPAPSDLRDALIEAGLAALAEEGLGGFTLRRISARAGVSHAAPRSHFGDFAGLRAAVAEHGFDMLGRALRQGISAAAPARADRAEAAMLAYIDFAKANAGLFLLMFSFGPEEDRDGIAGTAMRAALAPLHEIAAGLDLPTRAAPLEDGRSPGLYLWSLAHGQAHLAIGGGFALSAPPAPAERTTPRRAAALRRRGEAQAPRDRGGEAIALLSAPEAPGAPDPRRIAPRMRFASPYQFESLQAGPGAPTLPTPKERI